MLRRLLAPLSSAVALLLLLAAPAAAAWVVGAPAADGYAVGTTVQPPVLPTSTVTVSSVTLSWSPPTTGAPPSGYTVLRTSPTTGTVCVAVAATTCTDTGLSPSTTYTYAVTSLAGVWVSSDLVVSAATGALSPSAFLVTAPATATAGTAFSVTIQARDSTGANDATYTGTHALSFSGPGTVGGNAPVYPASAVFDAGGLATVSVTLFKAESVTVTVADGDPLRTGISGLIAVAPRPATSLRWTSDAAGLVDACPTGTVVVGPNGQRSWSVVLLDQYGNRAVQGAADRTVNVSRPGGGGASAGTFSTNLLTVPANADPAVTNTAVTLKLKKRNPADTAFRAASAGLSAVSCTLAVV